MKKKPESLLSCLCREVPRVVPPLLIITLTGWAGRNAIASPGRFGVIVGGNASRPEIVKAVTDLGATWVRLNCHMNGYDPDYRRFLDAGLNVVITFNNAESTNIQTAYGTPREWIHAGFPFRSKAAYQESLRRSLTPLLSYLRRGRQIWVQCENEISDASMNPKSRYWRGTTDQYLTQLQAFHETVRALSPSIPVVLTSFASQALDAAIDTHNPRHPFAVQFLTKLLKAEWYDAADLHLYGCVEDIPAKIQWIKVNMPTAKCWISTESGGPDYRCPSTPMHWEENPTKYEQMQAEQVPIRLKAAVDNGVSLCLWFSLFDLRNETGVFTHMGLVDVSSMPPRRKPAYEAFKTFVVANR